MKKRKRGILLAVITVFIPAVVGGAVLAAQSGIGQEPKMYRYDTFESFDGGYFSVGDGYYVQIELDGNGNWYSNTLNEKVFTYKNSSFEEVETQHKTITMTDIEGNLRKIDLVLIERDGAPPKVLPYDRGSLLLQQVGETIIFQLDTTSDLWVTTTSFDQVTNIQPDTVRDMSRTKLLAEKEKLVGTGVDTDAMLLYWVGNPILSPDGKHIIFVSNRIGFPQNCTNSIWITNLEGKTEKLIDAGDDGSISVMGWLSASEFLYSGTDLCTNVFSLGDGSSKPILDANTYVTEFVPNGRYLFFRKLGDRILQNDLYVLDMKSGESVKVAVPEEYRLEISAVWNENKTDTAFFVMNTEADHRLFVYHCKDSSITEVIPPESYTIGSPVLPSWQENNIIYCAHGMTFVAERTHK